MITVKVDDTRLKEVFSRLESRASNMSAPLQSCGELLRTSIDRNFSAQGRYSAAGDVRGGSRKWDDLAESTKLNKNGRYQILSSSGTLAASITPKVNGNTLLVGTNQPHAAIHNFGGKTKPHKIKPRNGKALKFKGKGGGDVFSKGVNHPGSNIPARPFLVVQDEDIDDMVDIIKKHILK